MNEIKYLVTMQGEGQGECGYTIGCNKNYKIFEGIDEKEILKRIYDHFIIVSFDELEMPDGSSEDEYSFEHYYGKNRLKGIHIYRISNSQYLKFEDIIKESAEFKHNQKIRKKWNAIQEKAYEKKEREEYKRLKRKYEQ